MLIIRTKISTRPGVRPFLLPALSSFHPPGLSPPRRSTFTTLTLEFHLHNIKHRPRCPLSPSQQAALSAVPAANYKTDVISFRFGSRPLSPLTLRPIVLLMFRLTLVFLLLYTETALVHSRRTLILRHRHHATPHTLKTPFAMGLGPRASRPATRG